MLKIKDDIFRIAFCGVKRCHRMFRVIKLVKGDMVNKAKMSSFLVLRNYSSGI